MRTKLKFKQIARNEVMPNGYRLAEFEEVRNNLDAIKQRVLLEKDETGRFLDGCILPGYRLKHVSQRCRWLVAVKEKERCRWLVAVKEKERCRWLVAVKEKEWDDDAGFWKKKCSACYPSNGNLLRKQLYDGVSLSPQGRDAAMALACDNHYAEVIYWLFKTTNPIEVQRFMNLLKETRGYTYTTKLALQMLENLLASKFPLELPLQHDRFIIHLKDGEIFAIIRFYTTYCTTSIGIALIELCVEMYSTNIVSYKIRDETSLLDGFINRANIDHEEWIPPLTKLLSVSQHSVKNEVYRNKDLFGDIFIEAIVRGYAQLVEELLKLKDCFEQLSTNVCVEVAAGAVRKGYLQCLSHFLYLLKQKAGNELQLDQHGKTLFHYAADSGNEEVFQLLVKTYRDEYRDKKKDKWGRNFLHWAALNGQADFCKDCVDEWQLKADAKDSFGWNSLHLAAKGKKGHLVVDYLVRSSSVDLIYERDDEGRTALHLASAKGNMEMVNKLLSFPAENPSRAKQYIQQPDVLGKTALQMAAAGGHTRVVQLLLDKGSDPLSQRDVNGSTALHYATLAENAEVAFALSQTLLNKYKDRSDEKSLLLWASAGGIGTAEEREDVHPSVKNFLLREKKGVKINLIVAAAKTNNAKMAWELLNRGARMADLDNYIRDYYRREDINNVKLAIREIEIAAIREIEILKEHGRDKPSLMDNLGRNDLAEGLAALFLNRFIESPITVGISGEWGMGKSSLMIQTEKILLMAAAQLSFPNLLRSEEFTGAEKISLSSKGRKIFKRMKSAMSKLSELQNKRYGLLELLEEYRPQYHAIYKSLACMDVHNQMLSSDVNRDTQFQQMGGARRILTVRYNAWHYRDEHEAWAGLAVTITKEIERAMTRAQWFSTCWRYSWAKSSVNICIQIFLPCLLATFLAGWVAWAAWTLFKDAKLKDLKYGSIPCTIIAIVWVVLKSVISVVKPVSTQMMGYITSPDHTIRLGYQDQVINDINFLKGELGRKPHWFFSFISGEWCWNWFGLHPDNVENTCIPKFMPASEDQLRMIAFVDDLDRCDEKIVLQVLSAINLVLAECKINVILGIDKQMINRAVKRHFEYNMFQRADHKYFEDNMFQRAAERHSENDVGDLADKFVCKIIQIPLSLPDLKDEEWDKFLYHYLGQPPPTRTKFGVEDSEDIDFGDIDTDNDDEAISDESTRQSNIVVNIDNNNRPQTIRRGVLKKVFIWLAHFFHILFSLSCNLSSKFQEMQDEIYEKGIRPLAFCKGAKLTSEMLLSNYSPQEAEILYKFKGFATGSQKLPREWKRFLDYYKFTCNVLSMRGVVYKLPSWKAELMAWIFVCWNWKHEMNTIFKGWHKYAVLQPKSLKDKDEVKHVYGPSLKQIIMNYVIELQESQHILDIEADVDRENLLKALNMQDVSMKGIKLFQQYRLHCVIDHLQ